jgi:hypothetical protein
VRGSRTVVASMDEHDKGVILEGEGITAGTQLSIPTPAGESAPSDAPVSTSEATARAVDDKLVEQGVDVKGVGVTADGVGTISVTLGTMPKATPAPKAPEPPKWKAPLERSLKGLRPVVEALFQAYPGGIYETVVDTRLGEYIGAPLDAATKKLTDKILATARKSGIIAEGEGGEGVLLWWGAGEDPRKTGADKATPEALPKAPPGKAKKGASGKAAAGKR